MSASAVKKTLLSALNNRFVPYMKAVGFLPGYTDFNAKAVSEIDKANAAVSARNTAKARSAEESA